MGSRRAPSPTDPSQAQALAPALTPTLALTRFAFDYLNNFYDQRATAISQNQMALQLLRSVYHLLEGGFYTAEQVAHIPNPNP